MRGLWLSVLVLLPVPAAAEDLQCHVVDIDFRPLESPNEPGMRFGLQMVAWLEKPTGEFVDTIFITQETGTFGLGNRPGRFDFNSGPEWPYGRRITVFPVWAHKHGLEYPQVVFQDGNDSDLSHEVEISSFENHFCQPLLRSDQRWDARTCATPHGIRTDKGILSNGVSLYPPRNDLVRLKEDDASTLMYGTLNSFDAVSMATPPAGVTSTVTWAVPDNLPLGDYVLWLEVSREFDHNATYTEAKYPSPSGIAYGNYGEAYRGQPSVVYQVPITVSAAPMEALTTSYVGYGDPDGLDGNVRPPDNTITTDIPGSGALRLGLVADGAAMYRVRARSHPEVDAIAPAAPKDVQVVDVKSISATLSFTAPGDDDFSGKVKQYELRYRVGEPITAANFDTSPQLVLTVPVSAGGTTQTIEVAGLLPSTDYSIGIRAVDNCRNTGPISVVELTTNERQFGQVDACFIATAAYGSTMANDVAALRSFRDAILRHTALGELAVEAYYTFGPPVAGVVGESELLRATARGALRPIVDRVHVR